MKHIQDNLKSLEDKINYIFKDKSLLNTALTHKSHKSKKNNERLEFLGDSIVNMVVANFLFQKLTDYPEGKMSKLRSSLVNEQSLEKFANRLKLGDFILLSQSEDRNGGRIKPSILSDAFEALIGAIYLDDGLKTCTALIEKMLVEEYGSQINLENLYKDYKTLLQEYTQSKFLCIPQYIVVNETGPEHQKIFEVCVLINDKKIANSKGKSKKDAQQKCAQIALELYLNNN